MTEQWRPVPGYEGYYAVSDAGRVRSIRRRRGSNAAILKPQPNVKSGYPCVSLSVGGVVRKRTVHSLVLLAFVGPAPEGMEGCHGDGNPGNSTLRNLRYDTPRENGQDRVRHGTTTAARAKLTAQQAARIRQLAPSGMTHAAIGAQFGVSRKTVADILNNKTWRTAA